jgi:hypothetical protein
MKNYPASTTALPLITAPLYAFLIDADWSKPLAAGVAIVIGFAPFVVAKISEALKSSDT